MLRRSPSVQRGNMSDETSSPRLSHPPEPAGQDGDITLLRKEVIEARNLVIKTDNLLKNLHAELKLMGRKHEEQEKRHWMTSVTAYVGFAVIAGVGAIAFANAEVRTARSDAQANGKLLAHLTDAALGTAVVAAGFTAYWYFYRYKRGAANAPSDRAKLDLVPWVQPSYGGMAIAGRF